MEQYIPKSVLVAEIERKKSLSTFQNEFAKGTRFGLEMAIEIINSLEVKEGDLKKEFSQWWKDERAKDYNVDILYERYSNVSMKLAEHFFELGLKAQKGE